MISVALWSFILAFDLLAQGYASSWPWLRLIIAVILMNFE